MAQLAIKGHATCGKEAPMYLNEKANKQAEEIAEILEPVKEIMEEIKLDIPDGYEFFGIDDDNKIVLAKKQPQCPKTYEECCKVLPLGEDGRLYTKGNIGTTMKLWIARSLDHSILLCTEKMSFDKQFKEWGSYYGSFLRLPKECFPEVTFENSPQEVELKLVK